MASRPSTRIARKARSKAESDFATWLRMARLGSFDDLPPNAQGFLTNYRARLERMSEAESGRSSRGPAARKSVPALLIFAAMVALIAAYRFLGALSRPSRGQVKCAGLWPGCFRSSPISRLVQGPSACRKRAKGGSHGRCPYDVSQPGRIIATDARIAEAPPQTSSAWR
jgi:hypothetical protein